MQNPRHGSKGLIASTLLFLTTGYVSTSQPSVPSSRFWPYSVLTLMLMLCHLPSIIKPKERTASQKTPIPRRGDNTRWLFSRAEGSKISYLSWESWQTAHGKAAKAEWLTGQNFILLTVSASPYHPHTHILNNPISLPPPPTPSLSHKQPT